MDKIKHLLCQQEIESKPPLSLLSPNTIFDQLFSYLQGLNFCKVELHRCIQLSESFGSQWEKKLCLARLLFLYLSSTVQPTQTCHTEALKIILHFYSFTYTYFTLEELENFKSKSEKVQIRNCDISNVASYSLDKTKKKDLNIVLQTEKPYRPQFVWGQLAAWWKQTIANPDASLSQDRRGTLSYPDFETSFFGSPPYFFPFQKTQQNAKEEFLAHLKKKPSYSWPPNTVKNQSVSWHFKNKKRMYGTVLFEAAFRKDEKPDFLEIVINCVNKEFPDKLLIFKSFEKQFFGTEEQVIDELLTNLLDRTALKKTSDIQNNSMPENENVEQQKHRRSQRKVLKNKCYGNSDDQQVNDLEQQQKKKKQVMKITKQIKKKQSLNSKITPKNQLQSEQPEKKSLDLKNIKSIIKKKKTMIKNQNKKKKNALLKLKKIKPNDQYNEQIQPSDSFEDNQNSNSNLNNSFKIKKKVKITE